MREIQKVRIHQMATTAREYDAITLVIGGLHMNCDLVNDRQIRQAKTLADSAGLSLEVCPELQARVDAALASMPAAEKTPAKRPTLAVVLEGGLVQSIVSDQPDNMPIGEVMVIDYDTEGAEDERIFCVPHGDGTSVDAVVHTLSVGQAEIDLTGIVPLDDPSPR